MQRIEFNAHRVFGLNYLLNLFENKYEIQSFSFVDDSGNFHKNIELTKSMIDKNLDCTYGCGIFILKKL